MNAAALKQRLRADLKSAMQAKATADVRALRALIAALDNAEAVPHEGLDAPQAFGAVAEAARRELDPAAVERVLANEVDTRLAAASDYDRNQRLDESARLRDEAELIARYRIT